MIVDILVGIFTLVCEFFSVLCSGLEFLCWVGEKLSYVASFFVCIGAAIFAGKSTYDINVREQKLLRQYYYSIFCPITEYVRGARPLDVCILSSHFPWSFHQDFPSVIIRFSLVRSSGFPGNYRDNSLVTEV